MADMILVGSKLAHSFYLEVMREGKIERLLLNGVNKDRSVTAPFFMPAVNAVGLTQVPRDFWEAWVKDHHDFAPYKNGFIFASDKKKRALDEANERGKMETGFERLNPEDIPKKHKNTEQVVQEL